MNAVAVKMTRQLLNSVEKITQKLLHGEFFYNEVHFIEEEFLPGEGASYIGFIYDVKGHFGESYKVSVFSHDGFTFEIRKHNDQGFDDLEGRFTL
ncbi:hypothetical protein [Domibacillus aminovorans]|uniref:Uncharacterized protein n=1 Tax=Domibacillus aminovorans TaxID=29332 RepID=A0A177L6C7_9BACI|nr:hypothetical protein [Domibacillus aminovorans]OAH61278.1 hypothetical protein AWH49_13910 [Domibacillus aminovorans]